MAWGRGLRGRVIKLAAARALSFALVISLLDLVGLRLLTRPVTCACVGEVKHADLSKWFAHVLEQVTKPMVKFSNGDSNSGTLEFDVSLPRPHRDLREGERPASCKATRMRNARARQNGLSAMQGAQLHGFRLVRCDGQVAVECLLCNKQFDAQSGRYFLNNYQAGTSSTTISASMWARTGNMRSLGSGVRLRKGARRISKESLGRSHLRGRCE